jgi:hypothetical protein
MRIHAAGRLFCVPLTRITSVPECAVSSVGFLWGPAAVWRSRGGSVGLAEALTQPRPTGPVAQLPEADDHFRVTWRSQSGPPGRGNSAPAESGVAIRPRVPGSRPAPDCSFWRRKRQRRGTPGAGDQCAGQQLGPIRASGPGVMAYLQAVPPPGRTSTLCTWRPSRSCLPTLRARRRCWAAGGRRLRAGAGRA